MTIPLLTSLLVLSPAVQNVPAKAEIKLDQNQSMAGSIVTGTVSLTFAPGLHGYQNPPSEDYMIPVTVKSIEGATILRISYPNGEAATVGGETNPAMTYSGTIEIPVMIRLNSPTGSQSLKVSVGYQQCNEHACFPPSTATASANITVKAVPSGWNSVKQRGFDLLVAGQKFNAGN